MSCNVASHCAVAVPRYHKSPLTYACLRCLGAPVSSLDSSGPVFTYRGLAYSASTRSYRLVGPPGHTDSCCSRFQLSSPTWSVRIRLTSSLVNGTSCGRSLGFLRSTMCQGPSIGGERRGMTTRIRSMTSADEVNQRMQSVDHDTPESPPEPPPPPDKPVNPRNVPPSIELEGERKPSSSFDETRTSDEADTSAESESPDDAMKWPKKLQNASVHERKCSERCEEVNSPHDTSDEPDEPGGEMTMPGGVHNVCPQCPGTP